MDINKITIHHANGDVEEFTDGNDFAFFIHAYLNYFNFVPVKKSRFFVVKQGARDCYIHKHTDKHAGTFYDKDITQAKHFKSAQAAKSWIPKDRRDSEWNWNILEFEGETLINTITDLKF